ncbi:hypothetical protein NE237_017560 [Protea cynaroides]|uniref:Uncharacterized protein n=1 Tax=Protea cynaroides TaxID=273540 RepID=A0A9Q0K880_9MAGN|nr:hypothetical protein NE237_017560 [Protea cynaroides]
MAFWCSTEGGGRGTAPQGGTGAISISNSENLICGVGARKSIAMYNMVSMYNNQMLHSLETFSRDIHTLEKNPTDQFKKKAIVSDLQTSFDLSGEKKSTWIYIFSKKSSSIAKRFETEYMKGLRDKILKEPAVI